MHVLTPANRTQIETAYQVLSDSAQRQHYDRARLWLVREAAAAEAKAARIQEFRAEDGRLGAQGESRHAYKQRLRDFWEHEHRIALAFTLERLKHQWSTMPSESQRLPLLHSLNRAIRDVWERINADCRAAVDDDDDDPDNEDDVLTKDGEFVFAGWPSLFANDLNCYVGLARCYFDRSQLIMKAVMTEHQCYGETASKSRPAKQHQEHHEHQELARAVRMGRRRKALEECLHLIADTEKSIRHVFRATSLLLEGPRHTTAGEGGA